MSYTTYRIINGALGLYCSLHLIGMALILISRGLQAIGDHGRRVVPGRLVIGAAAAMYAVSQTEEAIWQVRVRGTAGPVGRHINDANTTIVLTVSAVLFTWAFVRWARNDLDA